MDITDGSAVLVASAPSLPVEAPAREVTRARLARNTAALLGVDFPGRHPDSVIRYSDYNELTSADLSRGAPHGHVGPDGSTIVSAATVSKYSPEPKAAIILAGSNVLLDEAASTMRDVLRLLSHASDAHPLADVMRIAIWAALVAEVYARQPFLVVAALKARSIQRAALEPWQPRVVGQPEPGEYGRGAKRASVKWYEPRELSVVDGVMKEAVAPVLVAETGADTTNALLIENVISRFVTHLISGNYDSGLVQVRRDADGQGTVDVAMPVVALLATFTTTNLQTFDKVIPIGHAEPVAFDAWVPEHWQRILPRVPTKFEMANYGTTVQLAAIRALSIVFRVIQECHESFPSPDMRDECRRRQGELLELAVHACGESASLTLEVRATFLAKTQSDLRNSPARAFDPYQSAQEAGDALLATYRELKARSWAASAGTRLALLDQFSPALNMYARDLANTERSSDGAKIHDELLADWDAAFSELDLPLLTTPIDTWQAVAPSVLGPLHDWTALAMRLPRRAAHFERAIEIANDVVLPERRKLAERRRNERAYRISLQTLTRGLAELAATSPGSRATLQRLVDLGAGLFGTARVRELLTLPDGRWDEHDVVTAVAVVRIAVTLHDQSEAGEPIPAAAVDVLLDGAERAIERLAGDTAPLLPPNALVNELRQLGSRWRVTH